MKVAKDYVLKLGFVFKEILKAGPGVFFLSIGSMIITGVSPVITTYLTAKLIEELGMNIGNETSGIYFELLAILLGMLGVVVISFATEGVKTVICSVVGLKLSHNIENHIAEKFQSIKQERIDDPEFLNLHSNTLTKSGSEPLNLMEGLFGMIANLISLVGYAGIIIKLNLWAFLIIMVFTLPIIVYKRKYQGMLFRFFNERTMQMRRIWYYLSLITDPQYCKEIREFRLYSYFRKRRKESFDDFMKGNSKIAAKEILVSVITSFISMIGAILVGVWLIKNTLTGIVSVSDFYLFVTAKAIDILMKNSHESEICHVGFYGGEPLLRLNLIKECVAYIKEKYPFRKPAYNITTNAVLLDEDVAEFLIKNDIKIIISLDGPTQQLNKYRVFQNGKSSFDIVCKNIQMLYRKNPKYFRESVTYNVVMYNGASQELFEAVDNLWKSNVNMIDLFPTDYFMRVRDKSDESLLSAGRINIKSYDFAYKNMLKNMKKYYNSFNGPSGGNKILPGGFCIAGVRKNFVTTDGKIIVCEKVDESQEIFEIGDVDNGIDISKVRRLISYTLKRTEKCKKCWAAKFCKICFKDIININDEFCDKARKDVERELGYYLAQISGDRELINYISNISLI